MRVLIGIIERAHSQQFILIVQNQDSCNARLLYYLVWPNPKRLGLEDEGALSERERHSARLGVEGKVKVAVGPRHGEAGHHVVLVGDPDGAEAAGSRGHDAAADDRHGAVFGEMQS